MLGGGFPCGRIVELYGPSQIGKTSLALQAHDEVTIYFDLDKRLNKSYVDGLDTGILIPLQGRKWNNDYLFKVIEEELIQQDTIIVIDSLPMVGDHLTNEIERFKWLTESFLRLQRALLHTQSIVIVLSGQRQIPTTGRMYDANGGVLDPSVKIKMHTAENKKDGRLVYLDIEKCFWSNKDNLRCTLLVKKNEITEYSNE